MDAVTLAIELVRLLVLLVGKEKARSLLDDETVLAVNREADEAERLKFNPLL